MIEGLHCLLFWEIPPAAFTDYGGWDFFINRFFFPLTGTEVRIARYADFAHLALFTATGLTFSVLRMWRFRESFSTNLLLYCSYPVMLDCSRFDRWLCIGIELNCSQVAFKLSDQSYQQMVLFVFHHFHPAPILWSFFVVDVSARTAAFYFSFGYSLWLFGHLQRELYPLSTVTRVTFVLHNLIVLFTYSL